jgi:Animal haem peroxidase
MSPGPAAVVPEPTSPELVLVAPAELARLAREQLPDPSVPVWAARAEATATAPVPVAPVRPLPPPYPSFETEESARPRARTRLTPRRAVALFVGLGVVATSLAFAPAALNRRSVSPGRSFDGSGNNVEHPGWGRMGTPYLRVVKAAYADGIRKMLDGPSPRYISNRIFNDGGQNVLSENDVSQWGWVWGQFLDHTFGLRDERPGESAPIRFASTDRLERFRDDLGSIDFARTPAAPGTGVMTPRQETNTVSSYIDGFAVYGGRAKRLEWLRVGPVDGTLADNDASLLLPDNYLPRANARGDIAAAPSMDLMGALAGHRTTAVVAGDVRANENIALTAVHTLFAREHNRIVSLLPATLREEDKFEIARRVVGAEEQYVTYHEFLPAMGVHLPPYRGYDANVNASISNEFATVGYRVHSMVHGELEPEAPVGTYGSDQLEAFRHEGIEAESQGEEVKLVIPLGVAYGNPDLLTAVGLGPLLRGLGDERQYKNDEQIDDSMRSILFQIPKPGVRDPSVCGEPVVRPSCFSVVQDLGAIDVQRGRDHGIPPYNQLRIAYGLSPKPSYAAITGESTDRFARSRPISRRDPIDDPDILDFTKLEDGQGRAIPPKSDAASEDAVSAVRRSTLASRLRAIYGAGNVDRVDAFVGMLSEPHVPGTEFGELQLAMWKKQFEALRDGDRFFYLHDPLLVGIRQTYGIDYRQTLADIIRLNTDVTVRQDLFKAPREEADAGG